MAVAHKNMQPERFGQFVKKGCEHKVCNDKQEKGCIEREPEKQKKEKKEKKRYENRQSVGNIERTPVETRLNAVVLSAVRAGIVGLSHFPEIKVACLFKERPLVAGRTPLMDNSK